MAKIAVIGAGVSVLGNSPFIIPDTYLLTKGPDINDYYDVPRPLPKLPKPIKKCLQCGKDHTHNNCWCSAECAKIWREEKHHESDSIK